jgi:hypothetical protein
MIIVGAIASMFVLTYLVVGKGMSEIFIVLSLVIVFLVGFFSVKVSLMFLACSMLLSPEIGMGATSVRPVTGRIEDIVLFVLALGWLLRMAIFKDVGFMLMTKLNRPIIAFSTIAILSTSLGAFRGDVNSLVGLFFTLKIIEYFFVFYVVVNYIQTEKEVGNLLSILLVVCGIVCVYALVHRAAGGTIQAPFEGSEGEKNTLSGYLVLMGSTAAGVFLYTKNKIERLFLAGLLVLAFFVLLVSLSRSGWMSCIISGIVFFAVVKTKNIYVQLMVVALLFVPMFLPSDVIDRFKYTYTVTESSTRLITLFGIKFDPSSSARLSSWINILHYFPSHPLLGRGMTGYGFIDGQYFRMLAELGILGLCSFFWVLGSVHRTIRIAMKTDDLSPRMQGMVRGFYAGFWGILAHAVTANSFLIVRISEPFWFITGLIVAMLVLREHKVERTSILAVQEAVA